MLTDDNFATIARAVREGRVVFDNIKKSLLFILPTNGGEAGVILLAVFAGLALPITAGADPLGQHGHHRHAGAGAGLRAGRARRHAAPAAAAGRSR